MNGLVEAIELARRGRLYPSLILYGNTTEERIDAALMLVRTLLCEREPEARPCGSCRHCRRIVGPEDASGRFHPDFRLLVRDLKASTSVGATREMLRVAHQSPFEARGQAFVIASAESLTGEAANSLLKSLEEPPDTAPRHYILLAPSNFDLLPTLRSRSLAIYLGAAEAVRPEEVAETAERFAAAINGWHETQSAVYLLSGAAALEQASDFSDMRAGRPWAEAAAVIVRVVEEGSVPASLNRRLLGLADALLSAPALRLRSIKAGRILEGLMTRHLAGIEREAV